MKYIKTFEEFIAEEYNTLNEISSPKLNKLIKQVDKFAKDSHDKIQSGDHDEFEEKYYAKYSTALKAYKKGLELLKSNKVKFLNNGEKVPKKQHKTYANRFALMLEDIIIPPDQDKREEILDIILNAKTVTLDYLGTEGTRLGRVVEGFLIFDDKFKIPVNLVKYAGSFPILKV